MTNTTNTKTMSQDGSAAPLAETESSAAHFAAAPKQPDVTTDHSPLSGRSKSRRVQSGRSGAGLLFLVVFAMAAGAVLALYSVSHSPWLAQKIVFGTSGNDDLNARGRQDNGAGAGPSGASSTELNPADGQAIAGISNPGGNSSGVPSAGDLPTQRAGISNSVAEQIRTMQRLASVMAAISAGPRDPSANVPDLLHPAKTGSGLASPSTTTVTEINPAEQGPPSVEPSGLDSTPNRFGIWASDLLNKTGTFLASLLRVQQVSSPEFGLQAHSAYRLIEQRAQSHVVAARLMLLSDRSELALVEMQALQDLLVQHYDRSDPEVQSVQILLASLIAEMRDSQ